MPVKIDNPLWLRHLSQRERIANIRHPISLSPFGRDAHRAERVNKIY